MAKNATNVTDINLVLNLKGGVMGIKIQVGVNYIISDDINTCRVDFFFFFFFWTTHVSLF